MLKFLAICFVPLCVAGIVVVFRYDLGYLFEELWDLFIVTGSNFARWAGRFFEAPGL